MFAQWKPGSPAEPSPTGDDSHAPIRIASAAPEVRSTEEPLTSPGRELATHRLVPLLAWALTCVALLIIPFKIISYGYLPGDDALRHAAKAVSGRAWSDVLVLREEFTMDHNPGWHVVLGAIHRATGAEPDTLVALSVSGLFLAFMLVPLLWLRRPEAWLATLLIGTVLFPGTLLRVILGRPYVLTVAVMLVTLLLWRKEGRKTLAQVGLTTGLIALSAWIHGSWYLFALVPFSFCLAGRWREGVELVACWLGGSFLGALLTGHPFDFLWNAIQIAINCFGQNPLTRMLVTEFQPSGGAPFVVLLTAGFLLWRHLSGTWNWRAVNNPIFLLAVTGWVLGLKVTRFWDDWGLPALVLWMALELQDHCLRLLPAQAVRRLALTAALAVALFFAFTADLGGRYTSTLTNEYLTESDPEMDAWLPEDGGIVYSADMGVFYQTYFKNPQARWKYILGFEATFMPPEDLQIYRNIQWNFYSHAGYEPWVKKMRPEDRLILKSTSTTPPNIAGLDWKYVARQTWIGRLPRATRPVTNPAVGPAPGGL